MSEALGANGWLGVDAIGEAQTGVPGSLYAVNEWVLRAQRRTMASG